MGMSKRPQIGHVGTIEHEISNDEVTQPLQGGQGHVSGPQVPLLGHVDKIETQHWAIGCCLEI